MVKNDLTQFVIGRFCEEQHQTSSGQRSQMLFLESVGATLPVLLSQVLLLPLLTLHSFSSSSFSPRYFSSFSCSLGTWDWDCYTYQHCLLLMFVLHNLVQLVRHHQFVSLYLEVPHDLGLVILHYFRRCLPF